MPVLESKILTAGKTALSNALLGIAPASAHSFNVGDTAGYEPVVSNTAITGNLVFEGLATSITSTRLSEDTVRFVCTITESHGPFEVGNMILFMESIEDGVVPFIEVVLPVAITKTQSDPQLTAEGFQVPGSRLAINIELKHSDEVIIQSVTVITPNYASMPTFETQLDVPAGAALSFRQFVISWHSQTRSPVLATVDGGGIIWGIPYSQQVNDPDFGHLDGGQDGGGYGGEPDDIVFGYFYTTPEATFVSPYIGGATYTGIVSNIVGGASYTDTAASQTNYLP